MSKQTYKLCFCCRRNLRAEEPKAPREIKKLFGKYSRNGIMTADHFHRFLIEEQKENETSVVGAVVMLEEIRHRYKVLHSYGIYRETFFRFLFDEINTPLSPKSRDHQDMTAPLSHYFIYSGHNSYLTGNQVTSDCRDVSIIKALQKSVKVIELDMWPNSSKDNVEVLHGRTLTKPVELIKCLRSIKEHAFSASKFPVVITLEDHLTPDLQAKTTEMITKTFGKTLFSPSSECFRVLPSPESLKTLVMISTKPTKENLESMEVKEDSQRISKNSRDAEVWGEEIHSLKSHSPKHIELDDEDDYEDDTDDDNNISKNLTPPGYKNLIAIRAERPKGALSEVLKVDPEKVKCLSLSEDQLEKASELHGKEIVRFTQRNMLRIYPKETRYTSSNYNPLIGWMHGAQMVASNIQGYGRTLWLMQGMFRANGGCGYVKKPEILLNGNPDGEVFDPKVKLKVKKTLKVSVYMGEGWHYDFGKTHFDKYSPPDICVSIGIAGVPADSVMKKSKTVEDSWIPSWNESFEFPLTVPELALLRIEVHEFDMFEKDDFGGQTCLPVWELREGIRSVPLYCPKGNKYNSVKLLMRFHFI